MFNKSTSFLFLTTDIDCETRRRYDNFIIDKDRNTFSSLPFLFQTWKEDIKLLLMSSALFVLNLLHRRKGFFFIALKNYSGIISNQILLIVTKALLYLLFAALVKGIYIARKTIQPFFLQITNHLDAIFQYILNGNYLTCNAKIVNFPPIKHRILLKEDLEVLLLVMKHIMIPALVIPAPQRNDFTRELN